MTNITVALPDDVAAKARARGLLDPRQLTPLVCEALARAVEAPEEKKEAGKPSLSEALMSLAGAAGPGLPEDFASAHDRHIHGTAR